MDALDEQKIIRIADEFGNAAGEGEVFLQELAAGLLTCPEIGEEFLDYAENGQFAIP